MNNLKHPISWATILKKEHIKWKVIVYQNIITLEREIQGAINLENMVIMDFFVFYLY